MATEFCTEKYLDAQEKAIKDRISKFKGKLYIEFDGKLVDDGHAERVLKGYRPNTKVELLKRIKSDTDFIFCVSAKDIVTNRQRGDFRIGYDQETIRVLKKTKSLDLFIDKVVITLFKPEYSNNKKLIEFVKMLEDIGVEIFYHYYNKIDYSNFTKEELIKDCYIKTNKKIVVVTGAGGGSGKFRVCLTLLTHDHMSGIDSGYAKFETFPIWNLPLSHPINKAYESSTADLGDINMIDNSHKEAYGIEAVNYNRDVKNFNMMKKVLFKIVPKTNFIRTYKSPTDMGFNMIKKGIVDDQFMRECAIDECKRRVWRYTKEFMDGFTSKETVIRALKILEDVQKNYELGNSN